MRPRKVILLVCADERELSVQRFMLETREFRVVAAQTAEDALALFAPEVDLVVGMAGAHDRARGPGIDWSALARRVKQLCETTPVVLAGERLNADELAAADSVLTQKRLTPCELLECIKLRIARKRGPRRVRVMAPVAAMAARGLSYHAAARQSG
jgi:two-component system, OmpR family, response regulator CpxR